MKRTIALFALAILGTTVSALAQDRGVRTQVPFDFTVGGTLLPAGTYTAFTLSSGVLVIQSVDNSISASTTFTSNAQEQGPGSKWVFAKYGEQYFLRSVVSRSAGMHASVPASSLEKSFHHQLAYLRGGTPVLIAAN